MDAVVADSQEGPWASQLNIQIYAPTYARFGLYDQ